MTDQTQVQPKEHTGGAFLPDLCAPQAALLLILVAELLAVLLSVVDAGLRQVSWQDLALYSFYIQWIVLSSAALLCRLQPRLNRWHPVRAGLVSYGLVLLVTLIFSLLGQWLERQISDQLGGPNYWQLGENLLASAILAGIGLRYLYLQQQLHNQQQAELKARIDALQARIRPHFLFNSLNSIASLIDTEPELAERAVEDLAALFRASLAEPALIPLERELALCRGYLAMEQLRLGERLAVDWQLHEVPEGVQIPALLLQPLLENAVFHGIEPSPQGGQIRVRIARQGERLEIGIDNPLTDRPNPSHTPSPRPHNRMALENVRHRLEAHFGASAELSETSHQGRFQLTISYPLEVSHGRVDS